MNGATNLEKDMRISKRCPPKVSQAHHSPVPHIVKHSEQALWRSKHLGREALGALRDCVEQRLADFGEYMEEQLDPEHDTDNAADYWAAELGAEYAYDEED